MNTMSNDNYESDLFNSKKFAEDNIEDDMIKSQIQKDIRKMITHLPDDQREVVILRHYAGLSFKEIAEITDVSINTALGQDEICTYQSEENNGGKKDKPYIELILLWLTKLISALFRIFFWLCNIIIPVAVFSKKKT